MKKNCSKLSFIFLFTSYSLISAQIASFRMEDGTGTLRVRMTGTNPYLVLNNTHFINNASSSAFDPGAASGTSGIVLMTGNSNSDIGGSAVTTFSNLRTDKSNAEVRLQRNVDISYRASLIASTNNRVNLDDYQLRLLTNAIITGENITTSSGSRFYCDDNKPGTIRKDTSITNPSFVWTGENVGNMGVQIWSIGNLGPTVTIIRGHDAQHSTVPDAVPPGIGRYYDIIPGGVWLGINGGIRMYYHEAEVGGSFPSEGSLVFYRSPSYGADPSDWQEYGYGSYAGHYAGLGIWANNNTSSNFVELGSNQGGYMSTLGFHAFSRWTASDPFTNPLPVTLTNLFAVCQDNKMIISWSTSSEINSKEFVVYKSSDLQNWNFLASVPGSGNSNVLKNYSVVDPRPESGTNYYRLLQYDFNYADPKIYGPVSSNCEWNVNSLESLNFYPNPAQDWINVEVFLSENWDKGMIQIFDLTGKTVQSDNISLHEGFNSFQLDVSRLSQGSYSFVLSNSLRSFPVKKFVISRN